jgi:hypothetical protein
MLYFKLAHNGWRFVLLPIAAGATMFFAMHYRRQQTYSLYQIPLTCKKHGGSEAADGQLQTII